MRNLNLKPFLFILLGFSGVVWFAIATANGLDMKNLVDFMRPIPQVVTADLLLAGIFMQWGWRWKLLQSWLVPFPDLNGTWEGQIQSNWKDSVTLKASASTGKDRLGNFAIPTQVNPSSDYATEVHLTMALSFLIL